MNGKCFFVLYYGHVILNEWEMLLSSQWLTTSQEHFIGLGILVKKNGGMGTPPEQFQAWHIRNALLVKKHNACMYIILWYSNNFYSWHLTSKIYRDASNNVCWTVCEQGDLGASLVYNRMTLSAMKIISSLLLRYYCCRCNCRCRCHCHCHCHYCFCCYCFLISMLQGMQHLAFMLLLIWVIN